MQISENMLSILKLKALHYKEISFNRIDKAIKKPEMQIEKKTNMLSDDDCEVEIVFNLKYADYNIDISLIGNFTILCEDDNMKKQVIEKNTVSILFPYIRSEVTILTSQPELEPFIIPPLNINNLIDELNNNQ